MRGNWRQRKRKRRASRRDAGTHGESGRSVMICIKIEEWERVTVARARRLASPINNKVRQSGGNTKWDCKWRGSAALRSPKMREAFEI
jgi:hypothetical protein